MNNETKEIMTILDLTIESTSNEMSSNLTEHNKIMIDIAFKLLKSNFNINLLNFNEHKQKTLKGFFDDILNKKSAIEDKITKEIYLLLLIIRVNCFNFIKIKRFFIQKRNRKNDR
jgi:hypothetical protein